MKKIENNFQITGFVGKDAEIRQFTNASVARFSLAVSRQEKNGEENTRVSAGRLSFRRTLRYCNYGSQSRCKRLSYTSWRG